MGVLSVNESKLAEEFVVRLRALASEYVPQLPNLGADTLDRWLMGKRAHVVVKCMGVTVDISVTLETPSTIQVKGAV